MEPKYLLNLFLIISLQGYCQNSKSETEMDLNPKQEVLEVVKTWNDYFSANDPDNYFKFIHDDLTLYIPSSPYRIDGKDIDQEEFEYSLSKGWTKVGLFQELQPQVQLYDNTAIVTYYTRGSYGYGDSEKVVYLKETDVLVKQDGRWQIVHIHVSD